MPIELCRDCGEEFEKEEGRRGICPRCLVSRELEKDEPLPVDEVMKMHRKRMGWE